MKKLYIIYILLKDNEVFYIGVTTNIKQRYKSHQNTFGQNIFIKEIDNYVGYMQAAVCLEEFWIRHYRHLGYKILNKTNYHELDTVRCLECGLEIKQTDGKRKKIFCGNPCRSKYWQIENNLKNVPVEIHTKDGDIMFPSFDYQDRNDIQNKNRRPNILKLTPSEYASMKECTSENILKKIKNGAISKDSNIVNVVKSGREYIIEYKIFPNKYGN